MTRQFDDILLGSIELFCSTAELGSFTAAAAAAAVTPAAVSRAVSRLETRLGVRLFVRTTRTLKLSDAGRDYYAQCRAALNQLVEAERLVTGRQSAPSGVLRISMPTPYGHYRVLPLLPEFSRRYPEVRVEFHLSNRNVDFADEGFDLAIRGRAPADSTMSKPDCDTCSSGSVASSCAIACASPSKRRVSSVWNCGSLLFGSSGGLPPLGEASTMSAPASLNT